MYCGITVYISHQARRACSAAMYACCGATDYYLETGDQAYWEDAESTLGRSDRASTLCEWRRWERGLSARPLAISTSSQRTGVWRELRGDREHDVNCAHVGGIRGRESSPT